MRPVNRRTKASIARYNERSKIIDEKNTNRSLAKMIQKYKPQNRPLDPLALEPEAYETTAVVYVDKNNMALLPHFLDEVKANILVVNDSGKKINDDRVVEPEFYLGIAGGYNYAISIIDTSYITFMSVDDPFDPPEHCSDTCLIGAPGSISELWKTRTVPKILAIRADVARRVGFNWDITNNDLVIKEFIYHVAVQFNINHQEAPPYKLETNQKEAFEFRKDYINLFPAMFGPALAMRQYRKPKLIALR
jgi:hypothetical protein